LRTPDELSNLDDDYYDMEGDILYLENLLNEDPSLNLPPVKTEDLKQVDVTITKPSIDEPPELELKELPSHLEYAFLEGTDNIVGLGFGATTGSSIGTRVWATEGWMFSVLGCTVSFVTSGILGDEIEVEEVEAGDRWTTGCGTLLVLLVST
nr:reverse transcriptase domain-containing protein [Tanacetum cinerariifolium]